MKKQGQDVKAFINLTDVPGDYEGQSGKAVLVNQTEDGLEFGTASGESGFGELVSSVTIPSNTSEVVFSGLDQAFAGDYVLRHNWPGGSSSDRVYMYLIGTGCPGEVDANYSVYNSGSWPTYLPPIMLTMMGGAALSTRITRLPDGRFLYNTMGAIVNTVAWPDATQRSPLAVKTVSSGYSMPGSIKVKAASGYLTAGAVISLYKCVAP